MRKYAILAAGTAVLAAACTNGTTPTADPPGPDDPPVDGVRLAGLSLQPFDHCDALLDHLKAEARERVGPYGLDGVGGPGILEFDEIARAAVEDATSGPLPATGGDADSSNALAPQDGTDYSGTNVQEAGVDEPDVVKTDGERLFVAQDGQIHAVDVSGDTPEVVGTLAPPAGWNHELLLNGDRLFLLSQGEGVLFERLEEPAFSEVGIAAPFQETTILQEVDVSDPSAMEIVRTEEIEGRYLTARVVDGVARVVVTSYPRQPDFVYPSGPGGEAAATLANRSIIDSSTVEDWLPTSLSADDDGSDESEVDDPEPIVSCDDVSRPEEFSGFGMTTVLSVDLSEDLSVDDSVTVVADAGTVYGSGESLYVATSEWVDPILFQAIQEDLDEGQIDPSEADERMRELGGGTSIHKFAVAEPGPADYQASGTVRGRLLNQFAMSEHEGVLRVASTDGEMWQDTSESFVTTFEEQDGALVEVGQVGDMGKGEQIHSVRFIGDTGYVVTFRQTDPLYTVDLSDPENPTVVGELKILGFSAYLHPIDDDHLLGVGQDATEEGRRLGSQVSLFDVSDPADPTRVAQYDLGDGSSDVEWDHRAFTWWDPTRLAAIPVQTWDEGNQFTGAVGLTIDGDDIAELGRIAHGPDCVENQPAAVEGQGAPAIDEFIAECGYGPPITRAVVVGDDLLTISYNGIGVNDLETLAPIDVMEWIS